MKTRVKKLMMFIGIIAVLVILCLVILFIPAAASRVAGWTGTTAAKVVNTAVTVAGIGIGLVLTSFGVTALAVMPVVGIALIVVGVVLVGYCLWTSGWFGNSTSKVPIDDKSRLQKIA